MHRLELAGRRVTLLVQYTDANDRLKARYEAGAKDLVARTAAALATLDTASVVRGQ